MKSITILLIFSIMLALLIYLPPYAFMRGLAESNQLRSDNLALATENAMLRGRHPYRITVGGQELWCTDESVGDLK